MTNENEQLIRQIDTLHVLLYSFRQGCFHIETLEETMRSGLEAYAHKRTFQDYIVLAVHPDRRVIDAAYSHLISEYGRYEPTDERAVNI